MARRALAAFAVACLTALPAAGCALDDDGPAAGRSAPPLVTHPSQGPGGTPAGPGAGPIPAPEGACVEARDVTAALVDVDLDRPATGVGPPLAGAADRSSGRDVRPVQIVPRCSELEVPVPFTVPDAARRPGSV